MPRTFHQPPGRENARRQVEYATVKATLANRSDRGAILITTETVVIPVWIPPQALDTRGKIAAARAVLKTEITIGIELELALQKGLV
jgi:hypothetical protein